MMSPPLLLRLQADSPINRNALTVTRPARPNQLRFFKFFPPPQRRVNPRKRLERRRYKSGICDWQFVIGNCDPAIAQFSNHKSQITNHEFPYFDGAAGGVFASAAAGLCSGGATPASFSAWSRASRTSSAGP